jgi:hypothetical protein
MNRPGIALATLGAAVMVFGCTSSSSTSIHATAHIVRGASTTSSAALRAGTAKNQLGADGHWFLSPDEVQVTVKRIELVDTSGHSTQVQFDSCAPTFHGNAAELSSVLDCPFTLTQAGTFIGVNLTVDATAKVLIDDATNGIFTDPSSPTGLSRTAPTGGAQLVSMTASQSTDGLTSELLLSQPLVVTDQEADAGVAPTITVLADTIHTVFANISGSSATFDTSLPQPPVALVATADAIDSGQGSVEYYAPSGTAGNVTMPLASTGNETGSLRVFYTAPNQPALVWHVVPGPSEAWAASPASSAGTGSFKTGGYLGLDSTGTLCWALPTDFSYQTYSRLCRMQVPAAVGDTTTIECQSMSAVPAPVSGDTYASGCPSITPDSSTTVTLVAR